MNLHRHRCFPVVALLVATVGIALPLRAFPPAPDHVFFGIVRDSYGDPLTDTDAVLTFTTTSGTKITGRIKPGIEPGANYKLHVPMDAGLTSDAYQPTALLPTVPFKIQVKRGTTAYLPIEMSGDYARLGKPGKRTRLDLTLGTDSIGDGLPDAWRLALIAQSGRNLTLQDIQPNDDFDGDGMSNRDEYLAGTYAWDPTDSFELKVLRREGDLTDLSFTAITGRTYSLLGSPNLKDWSPLPFRVIAPDPESATRTSFAASDVRLLKVQVKSDDPSSTLLFFKVAVR